MCFVCNCYYATDIVEEWKFQAATLITMIKYCDNILGASLIFRFLNCSNIFTCCVFLFSNTIQIASMIMSSISEDSFNLTAIAKKRNFTTPFSLIVQLTLSGMKLSLQFKSSYCAILWMSLSYNYLHQSLITRNETIHLQKHYLIF